jgi:hypothetical protein
MSSTIQPYSWNQLPAECLMYCFVTGVFHLAVFLVGCTVLKALNLRRRVDFVKRVRRFGLFMGILLAVGSIFNGLWSCLIWGRLYVSTDYVFDFSPFWPITRKVIDAPFGEMRGELRSASLFQLQLVWLLFAIGTWMATILIYWRILRGRSRTPSARDKSPDPFHSDPA